MRDVDRPDVIVLGAGAAGVCCAAELTLQGLRPLLICESAEVGYQFRPMKMAGARPLRQMLGRSLYGEGGWWYSLLRRLDVPVKLHRGQPRVGATRVGSGVAKDAPSDMTASELADLLASRAPEPPGAASRVTLRSVLLTVLSMPRTELAGLHNVSLAEWVDKVGGDETVTELCVGFAASSSYLTRDQVERYVSVFGFFSRLRDFYFGEAELCAAEPDLRTGLFVPLAAALEHHGGIVQRGRKASTVMVENDRAVGVVMADGTEFRAPAVALAAGASRLMSLFPAAVPHELQAMRDFEATFGDYSEYMAMYLIDRKLFPERWPLISISDEQGGRLQFDFNVTALAPWCTDPGMEVIGSELIRRTSRVEAEGGTDALAASMRATTEALVPGLTEAIVEQAFNSHPPFLTPTLTGPKLPRPSPSLAGLWYVGEGSFPVESVYAEGASGAGVLGARAMAASLGG